ncbi:hypothetical protein RHMOL_Rhmol01G0243900 [Rhododendron molle]|nr:hypothetical protein RHMOL_Rhmol01G0243900 [Rhododendron molle]
MYSKNRNKKIELLEGLQIGKNDTVDHISPFRQDVFLVRGEHDQLFLLEKATELKKLLGEKTKLEVIKNTGSFASNRKSSPIQQNCVQVISWIHLITSS